MTRNRFVFVDALRGLAALSVVVYHAFEGGHIDGLARYLPGWFLTALGHGSLGVAVFFVLSGFVIAHSVQGDRVTFGYFGRFMLRRSLRLDPPYWVAVVLCIGFAALAARVMPAQQAPHVSLGQFAAHLVYLQEFLGVPEINVVFWTLTYEVQFYLVFVLILALTHNDPARSLQGPRTALALGAGAALSLLWPTGLLIQPPIPGLFLPLWFGFLLGVGAYWSWRERRLVPVFLLYAAVIAAGGLLRGDPFAITCALTAVALWAASVSGAIYRALGWRWLQFLGTISYSLYLTHNPITGAAFNVGFRLTGRSPAWEAFWWLGTTLACILFAAAVWWLVEKPSIALARRIALRPAAAPRPAWQPVLAE